jgi:hypothetical protein
MQHQHGAPAAIRHAVERFDALVCDQAVLDYIAGTLDISRSVVLLLQQLTDCLEAGAVHLA